VKKEKEKNGRDKRRKSEYDNDDDERLKNNFEVSRLHQPPHLQTQNEGEKENLIERTKKMQSCSRIYYSNVS